jgi:hypothetical protein
VRPRASENQLLTPNRHILADVAKSNSSLVQFADNAERQIIVARWPNCH